MKRVVLASFDRVPSPKGASQHILANARALRDRFDVSLVTLGDAPLEEFRHLAIDLVEPNWLRRALAFHDRVARVFEKNDFDAYHVRSPWEGLAAPADKPIVFEVNGLPSIELLYAFPDLVARDATIDRLRAIENAMIDRASLLVTPSEITAGYLGDRGADPARIAIVPNAPSIPVAAAPPPEREGPARLVYVGTLSAWQGLDELLAVLARFDRAFALTLCVPSIGRDARRIERLAKKRVGDRATVVAGASGEALARILADHDIGLAPLAPCARNLVQGCMPIKLLDYMATGLAVLAPDMPVTRAVLGDDALLYRRYSRKAMHDALAALVDSRELRAKLGAAGIARVRELFSESAQRDALLSAYARIAS
jgi:glycosyltransferase involved in cell wall biosynthesis